MKVLFSVYNISGYLISELSALPGDAEIVVIETPCNINKGTLQERAKWIDRREIKSLADALQRLEGFVPDVFICSGWSDKLMLRLAFELKKRGSKTVMTIDTPWQGKFKQFLNCAVNRFWLPKLFDYGWGAGSPQAGYLKKLGFKPNQIRTGVYSADTAKFAALAKRGQKNVSHNFLYVGRYIGVKNMRRMERAFIKAIEAMPTSDWNLVCIGKGALWDERTIHPRITHVGYIQPDKLQDYVGDSGCFVLPSIYEPWGVVTHEFAIMGLPLLCSKAVNSASEFLREGKNGFLFDPESVDSISEAMRKVMSMSDEELRQMGAESHRLGMSRTTDDWVAQVYAFAKGR